MTPGQKRAWGAVLIWGSCILLGVQCIVGLTIIIADSLERTQNLRLQNQQIAAETERVAREYSSMKALNNASLTFLSIPTIGTDNQMCLDARGLSPNECSPRFIDIKLENGIWIRVDRIQGRVGRKH